MGISYPQRANPTETPAPKWAKRLSELYGSPAEALWALLCVNWEQNGPRVQARWRTQVVEELSRMAGI